MARKYNSDKERVDAAWNKLEPLLKEQKRPLAKMKVFAIAASIILLSGVGILLWSNNNGMQVYSTNFGETLSVVLPDSSEVILNGNTKLFVPKRWAARGDRQVRVEGEAYFSIRHTRSNQKFFVKLDSQRAVEVLGTEFNVSNRKNETQVVLSSGKIALHMESPESDKGQVVPMKPGDLVSFDESKKGYTRKLVDPEVYSSWKSSKLIFNHTDLSEVLDILRDTYGLSIIVDDPALMTMKVSGSAPTKNADLLIEALAETLNLKFNRAGNTLTISSN